MCAAGVRPQASEVSRSRGASLMVRPGNSLVAAIRSQHQPDSQPLSAPCKSRHRSLVVKETQEVQGNLQNKRLCMSKFYKIEIFLTNFIQQSSCRMILVSLRELFLFIIFPLSCLFLCPQRTMIRS